MLNTYWKICRFQLGPQDLPSSQSLMVATLLLYMLISLIIAGFELTPVMALFYAILDATLLLGMIRMMLWVRDLWPRYLQTTTALLGVGVLFGFVAVPLMWWRLQYGDPMQAFMPSLLILGLMVWNAAVVGHILRHALNTPFYVGIALSLLYIYASATVLRAVFVTGS